MTAKKNWIPACAGMTSREELDSSLRWNDGKEELDSRLRGNDGKEELDFGFRRNDEQEKNWIPACAGMTAKEEELDSGMRRNDGERRRTGFRHALE